MYADKNVFDFISASPYQVRAVRKAIEESRK